MSDRAIAEAVAEPVVRETLTRQPFDFSAATQTQLIELEMVDAVA